MRKYYKILLTFMATIVISFHSIPFLNLLHMNKTVKVVKQDDKKLEFDKQQADIFTNLFNGGKAKIPIIVTEVPTQAQTQTKSIKPISRGGSPSDITPNNDEVMLLARLIQSESLDEPYEGKLWVGSVVVNRMRVYRKSMNQIIFQKSQFDGTKTKLFNSEPSEECITASKQILIGNIVSSEVLYFVDLRKCNPSWVRNLRVVTRVGTHTFYTEVVK